MTGCCGGRHRHRRVGRIQKRKKLPSNPRVKNAISLMYVGGPYRKLKGTSGMVYYVGPTRRGVRVSKMDVDALIDTRLFVELDQ